MLGVLRARTRWKDELPHNVAMLAFFEYRGQEPPDSFNVYSVRPRVYFS